MTSRERLALTLSHKEPDRVPLDFGAGKSCKFTKLFYKKLLDYFGIEEEIVLCHNWAQLVYPSERVLQLLGTDVRPLMPKKNPTDGPQEKWWEDEDWLYYSTEFGTKYRMPKKNGMYFDMFETPLADAEDEEDDKKMVWPEPPTIDPVSREIAEIHHRDGFPTVLTEQYGNGFLQFGPMIFGYQNWLMMLAAEPERCTEFMERLYEKKVVFWENRMKVYGDTADMISENDDFGTQAGLFVSPRMLRELVLPYHKKLYAKIREKYDVKVVLHSCGAISEIIPDLIELGIDALNPVQTTAAGMDPAQLKKNFGNDVTFWGGGIDTQKTLPHGTPAQVRDAVKRNLDIFAPGGGYVFSMIHNLQPDVPMENFIAMWEAYQENCRY